MEGGELVNLNHLKLNGFLDEFVCRASRSELETTKPVHQKAVCFDIREPHMLMSIKYRSAMKCLLKNSLNSDLKFY